MIAVARFTFRNMPEEAEEAPDPDLVDVDVAHPLAPAREVLARRREHRADVRERDLRGRRPRSGSRRPCEPMPNPLSRTQLVTVRLPMPPEPAVAASAPMRPQSIGCGRPGEAEEAR